MIIGKVMHQAMWINPQILDKIGATFLEEKPVGTFTKVSAKLARSATPPPQVTLIASRWPYFIVSNVFDAACSIINSLS